MAFYKNGKLKAFTLSYDDGITQDIRFIDLINRYGLKCTFNINSQLLGTNRILTGKGLRVSHYKIHPEDVKYVYDGHEVAVHTLTHPHLPKLEDKEVIYQVEQDRLNLSDLVGYEVVGMAYPGGGVNHDDRVANLIRENTGVKYSRTIICNNSFDPQDDLYKFSPSAYHLNFDSLMQLGEEFVNLDAKSPKIFYVWGHSYEMDYEPDYWLRLEEFFKLISGKDDIFYGTNTEVLL